MDGVCLRAVVSGRTGGPHTCPLQSVFALCPCAVRDPHRQAQPDHLPYASSFDACRIRLVGVPGNFPLWLGVPLLLRESVPFSSISLAASVTNKTFVRLQNALNASHENKKRLAFAVESAGDGSFEIDCGRQHDHSERCRLPAAGLCNRPGRRDPHVSISSIPTTGVPGWKISGNWCAAKLRNRIRSCAFAPTAAATSGCCIAPGCCPGGRTERRRSSWARSSTPAAGRGWRPNFAPPRNMPNSATGRRANFWPI